MFACLSDLRNGELAGLPSQPPRRYRFAWYPALGEFRVQVKNLGKKKFFRSVSGCVNPPGSDVGEQDLVAVPQQSLAAGLQRGDTAG